MNSLFDSFAEDYETWFKTPVGSLVKLSELDLVLDMVQPQSGELILDAGCGTGIFTEDLISSGAKLVGVDLSEPMLQFARKKELDLELVAADICKLPFEDAVFDKVVTITAIEFIAAGEAAITELMRVLKPGGLLVVATLNLLSAWNIKRKQQARAGNHAVFANAHFRSPADLRRLMGSRTVVRSSVHFTPQNDLDFLRRAEELGAQSKFMSGAFVVAAIRR